MSLETNFRRCFCGCDLEGLRPQLLFDGPALGAWEILVIHDLLGPTYPKVGPLGLGGQDTLRYSPCSSGKGGPWRLYAQLGQSGG